MKTFLGCAALAVAFLVPVSHAERQQQNTQSVLQAEAGGCRAYENNDVEGVRRFLADDYTLTNSKGVVTFKQDDLDDFLKHRMHYTKFENRNMRVRLYPGTAVVTGQTVLAGNSGTQPFAGEFQFTDTLIFMHQRWVIVASHATRLGNK